MGRCANSPTPYTRSPRAAGKRCFAWRRQVQPGVIRPLEGAPAGQNARKSPDRERKQSGAPPSARKGTTRPVGCPDDQNGHKQENKLWQPQWSQHAGLNTVLLEPPPTRAPLFEEHRRLEVNADVLLMARRSKESGPFRTSHRKQPAAPVGPTAARGREKRKYSCPSV